MKVAATCMFRDEARYLREWIEFHRLVGFDRLYLQNNLSEDDYMSVLLPYLKEGFVVLNQILSNEALELGWIMKVQNNAFQQAVVKARQDGITWLALLNSDEFLYPVEKDNIKDVLKEFAEDVGQISVNWQMFGHSFKALKPGELLTEHLTLTQKSDIENRHIKPIVRPEAVLACVNAHYVDLLPEYKTVNTHHQVREIHANWPATPPIPEDSFYPEDGEEYHVGPFDLPPRKDKLIINHYIYRDLSFRDQKCQFYRYFHYPEEAIIAGRDRANDIEHKVVHKYLPKLKERMR